LDHQFHLLEVVGVIEWVAIEDHQVGIVDKRLRQAFSLSTDRELMIETIHNIERLKAEGIPLEAYQHTAVRDRALEDDLVARLREFAFRRSEGGIE